MARTGSIGVVWGFRNTETLGTHPDRAGLFARQGVRVIHLTDNGRNAVGDGATVPDDRDPPQRMSDIRPGHRTIRGGRVYDPAAPEQALGMQPR